MKRLMLMLGIALAFSTVAVAGEIAISTQAGWFSQAAADREMQEIVDNVPDATIEVFAPDQQAALADWVTAHTGNGQNDLLLLCGVLPETIYAAGNTEPDGSLVELFLEDGNTIVNTGDYMFYVSSASINGDAGLKNIMDDPGASMWDGADVVVTAEGTEYTPGLANYNTPRPWHIDRLPADWEAELVLAQNAAGTLAEPAIVRDTYTGGRLGTFFQTANIDDEPRGEIISEWINNWYLPIGTSNPYAMREVPKTGDVVPETSVTLQWRSGDEASFHGVYFSEDFDAVNDGTVEAVVAMDTSLSTDAIPGYEGGLTPGQTYYWRVDEIAVGGAVYAGKVWSFRIQPIIAWNPSPAEGTINVRTDDVLSWTPGTGALYHVFFIGESFDDVNDAVDGGAFVFNAAYAAPLEEGKTYYWRIDEFNGAATNKGDVWSFSTVPAFEIGDPNLVGWWTLDESVDVTALDHSGYGNHGELMGNVARTNGFSGGAVEFSGGYVHSDAGADLGNDFTLAAWGKLTANTAGNYGGIGGRLMSLNGYFGFAIVRHSSNVYRLWVGDGTTNLQAISSDAAYTDTEWHHVAGVREGQTNALYVDGVMQSAPVDSGFVNSDQYFHIGKQYSTASDRTYLGLIDDVQLYNKALTAEEIAAVIAGNSVFMERFNAYEPGSQMHGQGGWKGWAGDAGAGALVSDVNDPVGAGAVEILGSSDLVHEFTTDSGLVTFTAMQYIPSGTTGTQYFILMSAYNDPGVDMEWSVQTVFNLDTGAITAYGGTTDVATIVYDQWVQVKCVIDLDNNTVDDYYNGTLIESRAWSASGKTTLQAIDLYGAGASSIYYDDIVIR